MRMPDPFGLEEYLHDHIPLSKHIGVRVQDASTDIIRLSLHSSQI